MNDPALESDPTVPVPAEESSHHWFWIDDEPYLHPTWPGTICILVSMALGYLFMDAAASATVARIAGSFLLGGLLLSVLCDLRVSFKNLVRIDLMALFALFYLTFAEFVFADQPIFSETVYVFDARNAVIAVYLGFAGIAVGRHLVPPGTGMPLEGDLGFPARFFFILLLGCFFMGNLYAFLAVSFNPVEWIHHLAGARFSQPWSRGKYGNWSTLLGEFKLLLFAIPALAGIIFAHARRFNAAHLAIVAVVLLLTLYAAFAEGTRNVLAMNLAALLGGYLIVQRHLKLRPILILSAITAVSFVFLSHHQLKFRTIGLRQYWNSGMWQDYLVPEVFKALSFEEDPDEEGPATEFEGFFVDLNLRNIAGLTQAFPERFGYLGLNVPFVALTKPVPRVLWPGKPEDFEVGIEAALSASAGYTLSCTFVGEGYMMWGNAGVLIFGVGFGAIFMYWNRLGSRNDSVFQRLVFATLFIPAIISMRSVIAFSTYLLVALALIAVGFVFLRYFDEDEVVEESA